ncbi:MAG: hypothetical protein WC346_03865 [Methanogenium sp.]|jgi:hypothetical protein
MEGEKNVTQNMGLNKQINLASGVSSNAPLVNPPTSSKTYTKEEVEVLLSKQKSELFNTKVDNKQDNKQDSEIQDVYIEERYVSIMRRETNSQYFNRNAKFIPEGKIVIGPSITGVNKMISNIDELKVYMPQIIGISASSNDFDNKLLAYFNNLSVNVPESGLSLNISFKYKNKNDYKLIKSNYDKIIRDFEIADKSFPDSRNKAFNDRTFSIIELEKVKYKYGTPININDYILWRYCLVYRDVAVDAALINNSAHIRFYIYDKEAEKYKSKVLLDIETKATKIYLELVENEDKLDQILWAGASDGTLNIGILSREEKANIIKGMVNTNPYGLISLYNDERTNIRSFIEQLIQANILKRLINSTVVMDGDNDIIGNNMDEVIAFFKNTELNKAKISKFTNQLKLLK